MPLSFALAVAVGAYLIGSLPSGFIVGRINGVDLRKVGSGNIGATNALRVLGKKWGLPRFCRGYPQGCAERCPLPTFLSRQIAPDHVTMAKILRRYIRGGLDTIFLHGSDSKAAKVSQTSAGIMIAMFPIWASCALL